jgi:hypothetical protein
MSATAAMETAATTAVKAPAATVSASSPLGKAGSDSKNER